MSFNKTELFGDTLLTKSGPSPTTDLLANIDYISIYFSAHWCPPCRGFTPVFAEKYNKLKENGKSFECIFASSDQDENAFKDYFNEMPWLALPYSDRALKEKLSNKYGVSGIPMLIIIDGKSGELITDNGRAGISGKNFVEDFPYHPKAMYDVGESMDGIAEKKSVLIVQDLCGDDEKKKNGEILMKVAEENKNFGKFFTANGGGPVGFIRTECKLPSVPKKHEHELVKTDVSKGCWGCDGCSKSGSQAKERFRCDQCDFDFCDLCNIESMKEVNDS